MEIDDTRSAQIIGLEKPCDSRLSSRDKKKFATLTSLQLSAGSLQFSRIYFDFHLRSS